MLGCNDNIANDMNEMHIYQPKRRSCHTEMITRQTTLNESILMNLQDIVVTL